MFKYTCLKSMSIMHEFIVRTENDIVIKRCNASHSIVDTISALRELVEECTRRFSAPVKSVVVRDKPGGVIARKPIHFTNICGKIDHVPHRPIYQPGVRPLLKSVKNAFGNFRGVYSRHCNLLTSTSKSSTLFRGGNCSKAIELVVGHAIDPDNINAMTVHMLVANARLGYGTRVDSRYVDACMINDNRWSCESMTQHEDMSYVKGLKLTNFDSDYVRSVGIPAPQSVVVNVSKHGSVNFFMTLASNVNFRRKIENDYIPFLESLMECIRDAT